MALTSQQQNFCNDMMQKGAELQTILQEIVDLKARWDLNDFFNQISDANLQATPQYAHLTTSNLGNAITAYSSVITALGDNVSGQQTNLIKLKG